jgi:hypothetical protein
MLNQTIPVSMLRFSSGVSVGKIRFSYSKTKEWLSNLFEKHNDQFQEEKDNPQTKLMNIPQSMINTAHALTQLYIAEFQKGKVKNGVMRVTKSYIQGFLVGSKLSIRTIDRHINRLLNHLHLPFISLKFRSTLGENTGPENVNTNCIALIFDPTVLRCENESHQKIFTENYNDTPKPPEVCFDGLGAICGDSPFSTGIKSLREQENELMRSYNPTGIGERMAQTVRAGSLFQNFGGSFDA